MRTDWVPDQQHVPSPLPLGGVRFSRWTETTRRNVAADLHKVRHWSLTEGDYTDAPDVEATWFVDPPYHRSGRYYMTNDVRYDELAGWVSTRRGQVTVCEQDGATWLPFDPLVSDRRTGKGMTHEVVWRGDDVG